MFKKYTQEKFIIKGKEIENNFEELKKRDEIKKQYCIKNNINF